MTDRSADPRGAETVLVWVSAALLVAAGSAIGVFVTTGDNALYYDDTIEPVLAALGWVALLAAPGVLAVLGLRDRPVLLLPAAVILVPLSFLSFAGALLPLLLGAVLLVRTYLRRRPTIDPRVPAACTTVVVVALLVGAAAVLVVHPDPRTYETATASGGTSDVLSGWEGLVMIVLSAVAVAVGWRLAEPGGRPAPGPGRKGP